MTVNGRKYGDKQSYPIPLWNGILDHRGRMGNALWEFVWCLDKITQEKDGIGIVLGGKPVTLEMIAGDVAGSGLDTVRVHLKSLEKEGYIRRRRTPYGHVIEVLNSRKRDIWKREKPENPVSQPKEKPGIPGTETGNPGDRNGKTGMSNKDSAVDLAFDSAKDLPQHPPSKSKATPKPAPQKDRFGTVLAYQGEA